MKSGFEGFGQDRSFSFVLIITPVATGMTTSTSRDRVGIFTDESNSFRRSWCARVEHAWKDAASGPGAGRRRIDSRLPSRGRAAARAAMCSSSAEIALWPGQSGRALLKFETRVQLAVRAGPACRIRPSNRGIASRRSTIASGAKPCRDTFLKQKCRSGRNEGSGGLIPSARGDGITRGTLLAVLSAPASGRHDATTMWGRQLVNKQSGKRR